MKFFLDFTFLISHWVKKIKPQAHRRGHFLANEAESRWEFIKYALAGVIFFMWKFLCFVGCTFFHIIFIHLRWFKSTMVVVEAQFNPIKRLISFFTFFSTLLCRPPFFPLLLKNRNAMRKTFEGGMEKWKAKATKKLCKRFFWYLTLLFI